MIPVVGIPILNRGDLLLRCLNSLAGAVNLMVVVDNSLSRDLSVRHALADLKSRFPAQLKVLKPKRNLGVAGSWNLLLDWVAARWRGAEWRALISNNDIEFNPRAIAAIEKAMSSTHPPELLIGDHGFAWFMLTRACVVKVGRFDERFYPAYFEDNDYHRRATLAGVRQARITKPRTQHGDATRGGSLTIHSDARLLRYHAKTFPRNGEYYVQKWGGYPGEEKFARPFGDPLKR